MPGGKGKRRHIKSQPNEGNKINKTSPGNKNKAKMDTSMSTGTLVHDSVDILSEGYANHDKSGQNKSSIISSNQTLNGINASVQEEYVEPNLTPTDKEELLNAIHGIGKAVGDRLDSFESKMRTELNMLKNDILTEVAKIRTRVESPETHQSTVIHQITVKVLPNT